jgi:hypothetical protein
MYVVTNAVGEVATSIDLVEWTKHEPAPTTAKIKSVVTGNNRIVLGDYLGNIFVSKVLIEVNVPGISGDYVKKAYVDAKFQEVYELATGAQIGIVFQNTEQLDEWIDGNYTRPDGKTPEDLKIGTAIYIIDTDEPDYWWDGSTYQEQEDKAEIDFTGYATEEYVNEKIETIDLGDAKNVWVAGNIVDKGNGTVEAQIVNSAGVPVGEIIKNIKVLKGGSLQIPPDNTVGTGGGFKRIYINAVNGNDNNDGSTEQTAVQTWDTVTGLLADTASVEVTILSNLPKIEIINCPNMSVIVPEIVTVNAIRIHNSVVRVIGTIKASCVVGTQNLIYVTGVSVVRFEQLVVEDTILNDAAKYYTIENASEVYVAGKAKHPNPYHHNIEFEPEGNEFPEGHTVTVTGDLDTYIFPTG